MSITVSHLTKIYGQQVAVNHISFSVQKGEIVGFLGPNGAGKSTTMKMITGYLEANEGSIEVCGIKVDAQSTESKKKIGYLPEANPLYFEMYVREYLEFIAGVHGITEKKIAIENAISTTGLTPEAHKKIGQLSKGYKQRVGIAAALIHNPEVLILDEPTSGLDPNQIIEIRAVIRNLGKDKTILFSSHILQEVEAICDRVIIINKGNIVADDALKNLMKGTAQNQLIVKLKEAVTANVFNGIEGITAIDANTWSFVTNDPDQLKRRLMEIALQQNLNIISWESETKGTLEDIFRQLTH
ncbi:MAG: gliding motility-associated ABC transporter ATP-binding subunit GldA [Ferruginibacter sp.]